MSIKIIYFIILVFTALTCIVVESKFSGKKQLSTSKFIGNFEKVIARNKRSTTTSSESSEEISEDMLKLFLEIGWTAAKSELLAGMIEAIADSETDITIIGWQNVHNEDGSLKEINTVELVIPPASDKPADDAEDDDDDDSSVSTMLRESKEIVMPMTNAGLPVLATIEQYDKHGNQTVFAYIDDKQAYAKEDHFGIYNKTETVTTDYLEKFIENVKANYRQYGVLKYDADGKLIKEKSKINPSFTASLVDYYEATDKMLEISPNILSTIHENYPKNEIPKQLALEMQKAFPEYDWRTLVDTAGYYLSRDVSVTLGYESLEIDPNDSVYYLVYGQNKTQE